ncbi:hypothetical protein NP493_53g02002 [Ridgeia piscesae]|uniref:Uncharacterized protein n=1 Tax=Ridgeia piscesae TaxID=27915 RepID=A0AAD9PAR3_RIDPI|nr:hypothetical protein NP493_53g02002 [Ridgeia piscesae]
MVRFRVSVVLRRLAIVAASNNHASNIACRKEVAMQLFEAYSALSCCFISDQLISMALLPGLRCLLRDMEQVAPDHAAVVASMIREFESGNTGDANSHAERNNDMASSTSAAMGLPPDVSTEDMRAKMMSRFKDVKDRASQSRTNFSKIFGAKK